jgi:uncharacterized protein
MSRSTLRAHVSRKLPARNPCAGCGGQCCQYFALNIDKPETHGEFENLRWYLLHKDCEIWVEDGDWYLQVNRPCKAVSRDGVCTIYEDRPTICRRYKADGCDRNGDGYEYEQHFREPEQIAEYARQELARKRRLRRRANANAKRKK